MAPGQGGDRGIGRVANLTYIVIFGVEYGGACAIIAGRKATWGDSGYCPEQKDAIGRLGHREDL